LLTEWKHWPQLTHLKLAYTKLTDEQVEGLLASLTRSRGQLRLLDLESMDLGNKTAQALSRCECLTDLRSLTLSMHKIRQRGLEVLARSELLTNLRELNLSNVKLGPKGAAILARASWRHLVYLDLARTGLTDRELEELVTSGLLNEVRAMSLVGNRHLTAAALQALVGEPHLVNLRRLWLGGAVLEGDGLARLAAAQHMRLRELRLPEGTLTERELELLTTAPVFSQLHTLSIPQTSVGQELQARLRQHFGSAVRFLDRYGA
jgi:hypothetical protein